MNWNILSTVFAALTIGIALIFIKRSQPVFAFFLIVAWVAFLLLPDPWNTLAGLIGMLLSFLCLYTTKKFLDQGSANKGQ